MRTRHRLALVAVGGLLLAGSVIATLTRDSAISKRVEALLANSLAAPCTFESAHLSFLEGLSVRGLRILDPNDPLRPPLVEADEARIDFHLGLLGTGPRVTLVILHRPTVRLRTDDDGALTLAGIVAPTDADAPGLRPPPMRIFDGTLVLEGAPFVLPNTVTTITGLRADVIADESGLRIPDARGVSDVLGDFVLTFNAAADGSVAAATIAIDAVDLETLRDADLPASLTEILREFEVAGVAQITARLEQRSDGALDLGFEATLSDVFATVAFPDDEGRPAPAPFRVALSQATVALDAGRLTLRDAAGTVFGAAFSVDGGVDVAGFAKSLDEDDQTIDVTLTVKGAMIDAGLARHFPFELRDVRSALDLSGRVDAEVNLSGGLRQIATHATLRVRDVSASYVGFVDPLTGRREGFPWRVDDLNGEIVVADSRVDFDARGTHGPATVHVLGFTDANARSETITDVRIDATDVPLDADLHAGFGDRGDEVLGPWKPAGIAARIEVHVEQDPEISVENVATQIVATLDGRATFTPHVLPTQLSDVTGVVHILEPVIDGARRDLVRLENVAARGEGFRIVSANGDASTDSENLSLEFYVDSMEGAFHTGLLASSVVPESVKTALRLLEPHGKATITARIVGAPAGRDDDITIALDGLGVRGWEDVPLAIANLEGTLTYADDELVTEGLRGTILGDAPIHVAGRLAGLSEDTPIPDLVIRLTGAPLDRRVEDALGVLAEDVGAVWDEFPAEPDLRADATVTVRPPGHADGEFSLLLENLRGGISVLGLRLGVTAGRVSYEHGVVRGGVRAALGAGDLTVPAFTYWTETEDAEVALDMRGLSFPGDLVPLLDHETAEAIAGALAPSFLHVRSGQLNWEAAARTLRASADTWLRPAARDGTNAGVSAEAHLELKDVSVTLPEIGPSEFEGRATLQDVALDPGLPIEDLTSDLAFRGKLGDGPADVEFILTNGTARAGGLLVEDLALRMEIEGERVRVPTIAGSLYGGALTARFNTGGERLAYRGSIEVKGADLALHAADQESEAASGLVDLDVRIRNPSGKPEDLEGTGTATLSGAAVRIPWLTAAAKAVNNAFLGAASIEGNFRDGEIDFDLRGHRVLIRDFHFEGPNVPLLFDARIVLRDGRGAVNLEDGRLNLVVYPRLELGVFDYDPTGIFDRVLGLAQFLVRRLRIEGTTRNPRTSWEIIPGDPDEEFRPRPRPIGDVRRYGPEPW